MTNHAPQNQRPSTVHNRPKPAPEWTEAELLNQNGIFFLEDVAAVLPLNVAQLKQEARNMQRQGISPWQELGLRKVWNQWVVRMHTFRKYYGRQHI